MPRVKNLEEDLKTRLLANGFDEEESSISLGFLGKVINIPDISDASLASYLKKLLDSGSLPDEIALDALLRKMLVGIEAEDWAAEPHLFEIFKRMLADSGIGARWDIFVRWAEHPIGAELLVSALSDENAKNIIQFALDEDNPTLLQAFSREGMRYRVIESNWVTPLIYAIIRAKTHAIQFSCAAGLTTNSVDSYGITPLLWSVIFGIERDHYEALRYLSSLGANANQEDRFGNTPLITAMRQVLKGAGRVPTNCLKILLAPPLNANPNQADGLGRIPILEAIHLNQTDSLKLLIDHNCDLLCKSAHGEIPLQVAERLGKKNMVDLLRKRTDEQINQKLSELLNQGQQTEAREIAEKLLVNKGLNPEYAWNADVATFLRSVGEKEKIEREKTKEKEKADFIDPLLKLLEGERDSKKTTQAQRDALYQQLKAFLEPKISENKDISEFEKYLNAELPGYATHYRYAKFHNLAQALVAGMNNEKMNDEMMLDRLRQYGDPMDFLVWAAKTLIGSEVFFLKLYKIILGREWSLGLYRAIKNDEVALKNLVALGSGFHSTDSENQSIWHQAIRDNNLHALEILLSTISPERRRVIFNTTYEVCPLRLAIRTENNDILKWLLEQGGDPIYGCNPRQRTLLEESFTSSQRAIIQEALARKKAKEQGQEQHKASVEPSLKQEKTVVRIDAAKQNLAKRMAHFLGLRQVAVTLGENETQKITVEGTETSTGNQWVCEVLKKYNENSAKEGKAEKDFREIEAAFLDAQACLDHKKSILSLLQRYDRGKLLVLPVAWGGHGICITLKGERLSISNRGQGGDQSHGTKIYAIQNPAQIETFILKIMTDLQIAISQGLLTDRDSQNFIMNALRSVVDLEQPFDQLDQKGQKWGTCAVANRKAAVQGALYLLAIEDAESTSKVKAETDWDALKADCRKNSKEKYKHFTNAMRNNELDTLMVELRTAKENKEQNLSVYYDILTAIILEHNDFNKKNKQQGERILKIWAELPKEYQERIHKALPDFQERKTQFMLMYKASKEKSAKQDEGQELEKKEKSKTDDYRP